MNKTLLLTLLPLAFSMPQALAKSDLEALRARCAEQERQIRELEHENAKLRSLHEPSLPVKSAPTGAATGANLEAAPPTGAPIRYEVRPGDSWERIARKYGTSTSELAQLNGSTATRMLHAGQKLKVPGPTKAAVAAIPSPVPTPTPAAAPAPAAPTPETPPPASQVHRVKQGETFYSIGRSYGVSSDDLMAANPDLKASALRPGLQVKLTPSAAPAPAGAEVAKKPAFPAAAARPGTASAQAASGSKPASVTPPATKTAPDKTRIKSVTIDGKTTFGEFATRHGSDVSQLNDLNALDLVETTVLAKGSELYVPAQP